MLFRRMQRFFARTVRWLIASLLLLASVLPAYSKELKIENFVAQVDVLPDSSVNVSETITVHFIGGPWHGLYRLIPVEYFTPQGMNYALLLSITRVTDGAGHNLRYESSRDRH